MSGAGFAVGTFVVWPGNEIVIPPGIRIFGILTPIRCHKLSFISGDAALRAAEPSEPRTFMVRFFASILIMRPVVAIDICSGSRLNLSVANADAVTSKTIAIDRIRFMGSHYTPGEG